MPHSIIISIECSRGPRHYAVRQCVLDDEGRAQWLPPDMSACPLEVRTHAQANMAMLPFTDVATYRESNATVAEALELLQAVLDLASSHNVSVYNKVERLPVHYLLKPVEFTVAFLSLPDDLRG